jgi:hypothetical protein
MILNTDSGLLKNDNTTTVATFTQTTTFVNGASADGGQVNTEIVNLGSSVNNVVAGQLDLANNVYVQIKNSSGTKTDVLKLGSDNIIHLSQIPDRVEGSSAGSFATNVRTDLVIITGMFYKAANTGVAVIDSATITLPVTMDDTDYSVLLTSIGTSTDNPSGRADTDGNSELFIAQVKSGSKTTSQFVAQLAQPSGSNFAGTMRLMCEFLIIGEKA